MVDPGDQRVEREARVLAEYLIRGSLRPEVTARYRLACESHGLLPAEVDDGILRAVRERPWLVGPLEAASAWIAPEHALRKKTLLMLAVLETVPALSRHFVPLDAPHRPRAAEVLRLLALAAAAVGKAGLGIALWHWLGRERGPRG